jgi:hypothetical protein
MKRILAASLILAFLASPALAEDPATGEQIKAAIAGNTVQGSMMSSGPYAEFYAADGSIKGKDYTGKWTIDGNAMCFQYGSDPVACYGVVVKGDQVTWLKDGKEDGTGTIVKGNANNF